MTDKIVVKESFVDRALRVLDEIELKEKGKRAITFFERKQKDGEKA